MRRRLVDRRRRRKIRTLAEANRRLIACRNRLGCRGIRGKLLAVFAAGPKILVWLVRLLCRELRPTALVALLRVAFVLLRLRRRSDGTGSWECGVAGMAGKRRLLRTDLLLVRGLLLVHGSLLLETTLGPPAAAMSIWVGPAVRTVPLARNPAPARRG